MLGCALLLVLWWYAFQNLTVGNHGSVKYNVSNDDDNLQVVTVLNCLHGR